MATKIFLVFVLLAVYGICIPLYRAIEPPASGFFIYVVWLLFLGAIWLFLVFCTNAIV